MKLKVMIDEGGFRPVRAHRQDAGLDLISPVDVVIEPHGRQIIDTRVHVAIPEGYVGMLTSKSGLMRDYGVKSTGTIDAGYTGSIGAVLFNHSDEAVSILRGQKVTQLVVYPIETPEIEIVTEMPKTDRGAGGFGSTGDVAMEAESVRPERIPWEAD